MKKKYTLFLILVITSQLFVGCNRSEKGSWTEADKQSFRTDMLSIPELSNFGENKMRFVECYLSKCEANYTSYFEADQDEKGCEILALECRNEVMSNGSKKGHWSESDKEKFRSDMQSIPELSSFGENKSNFIECYLTKCEAHYSSYFEADQDPKGCEQIVFECSDAILSNQ